MHLKFRNLFSNVYVGYLSRFIALIILHVMIIFGSGKLYSLMANVTLEAMVFLVIDYCYVSSSYCMYLNDTQVKNILYQVKIYYLF